MSGIYGIDSQTYRHLPPEDQAAIRAGWEDRQADARTVDAGAVASKVLDAPYYGRTTALVDALRDMSPENAQRVLQEIRGREPETWPGLVNTAALDQLRGASYPERGLRVLADALALEHAAGHLASDDIGGLFGAGMAGAEQVQASGAQLLFGASDSPEMQRFERAMADHALQSLVQADRRSASHGTDTLTTGVADIIAKGLGTDSAGRQALIQSYGGLGADERGHVRDLLADKGWVGADRDRPNNPDALGVLMRGIAEDYGADGGRLAVEFVDWAGGNQEAFIKDDIFGTSSSGPRAEALALMTANHGDAVFAHLSNGYGDSSGYAGDDSRVLGFVLSLTTSNDANPHSRRVTQALDQYVDGLVARVEADPASAAAQDPLGRLEILAPALLIAEAAPQLHDLGSDKARVDGILRVLDVVSTGAGLVPGGKAALFITASYGDINGLTDEQIKKGVGEYLTSAMSGSEQEREAALREVVDMVQAGIERDYGHVPAVSGAMTRRLEDTLYDMLVAISTNNVDGYLKTLDLG